MFALMPSLSGEGGTQPLSVAGLPRTSRLTNTDLVIYLGQRVGFGEITPDEAKMLYENLKSVKGWDSGYVANGF